MFQKFFVSSFDRKIANFAQKRKIFAWDAKTEENFRITCKICDLTIEFWKRYHMSGIYMIRHGAGAITDKRIST